MNIFVFKLNEETFLDNFSGLTITKYYWPFLRFYITIFFPSYCIHIEGFFYEQIMPIDVSRNSCIYLSGMLTIWQLVIFTSEIYIPIKLLSVSITYRWPPIPCNDRSLIGYMMALNN